MDKPNITWFVKRDDSYIPLEEFHFGEYVFGDKMVIEMQIWNNRWSLTDVQDLEMPGIVIYFDTIEDSKLLEMCSIEVEGAPLDLYIENNQARAMLFTDEGRKIMGQSNNGLPTENPYNFVDITFKFSAGDKRLKNNDLKNLYFELVSMN